MRRFWLMCLVLINALTVKCQKPNYNYNLGTHLREIRSNLNATVHSRHVERAFILKRIFELSNATEVISAAIRAQKNLTSACTNQTAYLLEHIGASFSLLDSWGKPEAGILQGNTNWMGNYDECLSVIVDTNGTSSENITMRSCSAGTGVGVTTLGIGICVPRGCNADDVSMLMDTVLHLLNIPLDVEVSCQQLPSERDFGTGSIVIAVILSLMVGLCCLATLYEILMELLKAYQSNAKLEVAAAEEYAPLISKSTPNEEAPGWLSKFLLSFSLYTNGRRLLSTEQPPGVIECLHGIRFLSMCWVVLGHTLLFYTIGRIKNPTFLMSLTQRWTAQPLLNATVSVDSFFVLSGFLLAYLLLKDFTRRRIRLVEFFKALPMIYFQRYFRLTPALGFTIMLWGGIWFFIWDGPSWPNYHQHPQVFDQYCPDYWYRNVLYLNNLFNNTEQCAGWQWYLANDFQFFIIAPFVVFLFFSHQIIGVIVSVVMVIGSIVAAFVVSNQQDTSFGLPFISKINFTGPLVAPTLTEYMVPWTRYQSYGIGLTAGLIFYKLKEVKYQIPTLLNLFMWGVSAGACISVVYGPYDADTGGHIISLTESTFYNALSRSAWSIGLSYVIIACALGQGGWVNELLSWRGFVVPSKLTYSAYQIHIPIISLFIAGSRSRQIYTDLYIVFDIVFFIVIALLASFPFSLIFEVPFTNLDKHFISPHSIKQSHRVRGAAESSNVNLCKEDVDVTSDAKKLLA